MQNIGFASAAEAELSALMYAVEKAVEMNWTDIWIESDSLVVVKAFTSGASVPWQIRNR